MMIENRQLLVLTHLSQLLDFVTGIGGFLVPLIIWLIKKDEVFDMDRHGKAILNFRISMFIYILICSSYTFIWFGNSWVYCYWYILPNFPYN